ncbi:enoyl-CoA-hydratase DpgB [Variovorax boronicumulans]|uniref:enoyl-CoA-hydratase DpgB n=1 Tax=Variovorax boronicumulans TaxID=436515 RepID=UPI00339309E7
MNLAPTLALRLVHLDIDSGLPLSDDLASAVRAACDDVDDGPSPAVLLIRIRGTDATVAWPGDVRVNQVNRWEQAMNRLSRLAGVSVAVVSGGCGGLALELLTAADHRIAAHDFRLDRLCAAGASWPGMALHRLVHRQGPCAARRLFVFPAPLQAAQALQLGVIDEVAANADEAADVFIEGLRGFDFAAVPARRLLIAESQQGTYEEVLGSHLAACDVELRRRAAAGNRAEGSGESSSKRAAA